MEKKLRRRLIIAAAKVLFVVLLHFALLHWHAGRNTVAKLFSAGKHLPPATMFSVILFMTVRLFAMLCIPAMILEEIGKAVVDRYFCPESE